MKVTVNDEAILIARKADDRTRGYLGAVEGWLRDWRGIAWPEGCIDDLNERVGAALRREPREVLLDQFIQIAVVRDGASCRDDVYALAASGDVWLLRGSLSDPYWVNLPTKLKRTNWP